MKDVKSQIVTLRSNATYPIMITYKGENTFIPPLGVLENVNKNDLGNLPKCVRIVKNK